MAVSLSPVLVIVVINCSYSFSTKVIHGNCASAALTLCRIARINNWWSEGVWGSALSSSLIAKWDSNKRKWPGRPCTRAPFKVTASHQLNRVITVREIVSVHLAVLSKRKCENQNKSKCGIKRHLNEVKQITRGSGSTAFKIHNNSNSFSPHL